MRLILHCKEPVKAYGSSRQMFFLDLLASLTTAHRGTSALSDECCGAALLFSPIIFDPTLMSGGAKTFHPAKVCAW
jgi:hypothetical protein